MPGKSKTVLKVLQARLKGQQTTFENMYQFMMSWTDAVNLTEVKVRLERLDRLWDRMNECREEVEAHEDNTADPETFVTDRIAFENRYFELKSFLMDKLKENTDDSVLNTNTRSHENTLPGSTPHVKLPQITLPKFNGKIDEWLTFRDLYTSLIHWQPDLPDIEKFHYLRSLLEGRALSIIEPLKLIKSNYAVAWELLCKEYSDTKSLRKQQVQALFDLPVMRKESPTDLHSLLDSYERIVKSLDQVTEPAQYKDLLLLHLLSSRLDNATRRGWEELSSTKDTVTVKDLTDFLQRRVRVLESLPTRPAEQRNETAATKPAKRVSTVRSCNGTFQSGLPKCVVCSDYHLLYTCPKFLKMSVQERDDQLRTHALCRNCFRDDHLARDCRSKYTCRNCKAKHHTLVCFKGKATDTRPATNTKESTNTTTESAVEDTNTKVVNSATTSYVTCNTTTGSTAGVLLLTAMVVLEDDQGHRVQARALLDSAAECNLMSRHMRKQLMLREARSTVQVVGIQGISSKVQSKVNVTVRSRTSQYSQSIEVYVMPKLASQSAVATVNTSGWNLPAGIELADQKFLESLPIDLVLGAEHFFDFFVSGRRIQLGDNLPLLVDSVFGWVVTGRYPVDGPITSVLCDAVASSRLDELIEKFWEYEEVGLENNYSPDEARCEDHFVRTTQRQASGRYQVSLPRNEELIRSLGDSKVTAERRFFQIERRLNRDSSLRDQYVAFMEEYEALGHMRRVSAEEEGVDRFYLPHHPVVREASTTTKVRVVFDASAKTSTNLSVNDCLHSGPIIQRSLRSIILRSRFRPIMVVADIEKMFRQVDVCPEDRRYQSILWRPTPDQPLATYELSTVTYGTKPAPFLATRTLVQLAADEAERYPLASAAVKEDFYMDDAITGADDPTIAKRLRIELQEMMEAGGFKLRKFASNCAEVLEGLPNDDLSIQATDGIYLDPDPMVKTLGLIWMPHTDVFRFQFKAPPLSDTPLTKQQLFSIIASLFDPLGFVGPVITRAKIMMQQSWQLLDEKGSKLTWTSPLPPRIDAEFRKFYEQIPRLNELRIKRVVVIPGAVVIQLHFFSDASEKALGAVAYVRSEDASGHILVAPLMSKSRVAPLKTQCIPRLELRGTTLSAEMYVEVMESLELAHLSPEVFFWTDSEIVLRWLAAIPATWTTFVANRVAKIQRLTENCHWNHCSGKRNPADLISRGVAPEDLLDEPLWWEADWLLLSMEHWPTRRVFTADGLEEERRKVVSAATAVEPSFIDKYIARYSVYPTMVRHAAWFRRCILDLRTPKDDRIIGPLTSAELLQAETKILQLVQRENFAGELKSIAKGECTSRSSPLRWYNPFVSPDGLLRVGGRLGNSGECESVKHPIVLPARHALTKLLMRHYHLKLLHAGPQLILSSIRLRYWPLGGRNVAREVCHQCVDCYKTKPTNIHQFMAELPTPRVVPSKPFSTTGVDYFGPIYVRPGYRRAAVKAYVAVFVCFSTKAVHLELVTDLSTPCFIQALRRFISRRGKCAKLYSDNGTNFVGARNQLEELFKLMRTKEHREAVVKWCADDGMDWSFIPPGAPHFGGLWESAVRAAKVHLLKVLGDTAVSYEDMVTLLCQVECCLNSRPLTQLSEDPNDLEPLTPGHFLVTTSLQALPELDLTDVATGRLNHRDQIQQLLQLYWKRWRSEYLTQLQERTKWWKPPKEIKPGSLVIIRDDNQPPTRWKMARILEVFPGNDDVVRVVSLKTADGIIKRPVSKICILPVEPVVNSKEDTEVSSAEPKEGGIAETPDVSEGGRMLGTTPCSSPK